MSRPRPEELGVYRRVPRLGGLALVYAIVVAGLTLGTIFGILYVAKLYPTWRGYRVEEFALPLGAFVLLFSSIIGIVDVVYRADRQLAEGVYANLATWLSPREAAVATRRLLSALESDDYTVITGMASLYAERVLLPRVKEALKAEIIGEILDAGIEIESIPPAPAKPQPRPTTPQRVFAHAGSNGKKPVAVCPVHGQLSSAEIFRENGSAFCIYCGRKVKPLVRA